MREPTFSRARPKLRLFLTLRTRSLAPECTGRAWSLRGVLFALTSLHFAPLIRGASQRWGPCLLSTIRRIWRRFAMEKANCFDWRSHHHSCIPSPKLLCRHVSVVSQVFFAHVRVMPRGKRDHDIRSQFGLKVALPSFPSFPSFCHYFPSACPDL